MEDVEKCGAALSCGHHCHGYKGESNHLSCLEKGCDFVSKYQTGDDACAICLDELKEAVCIELNCGHIWHLECLKHQLKLAQPNPNKRLQFSGCSCAQCGKFCEHEALRNVIRKVASLKEKVDALIAQQIKIDQLEKAPSVATEGGAYYGNVVDYGRHIYAFYLCSICEDPFFGGTVACAENESGEVAAGERKCSKCDERGLAVCRESSHRGYHVWKCRYCCNTASFVCYGSTHLCIDCHDRNNVRERAEKLNPISCPGSTSCSTRLDAGNESHLNGPGPECEQLLYCAWCESDPSGRNLSHMERGSPSMLYNGDGSLAVRGWVQFTRMPWSTESSELPIFNSTTNFVSSYSPSIMCQAVNLTDFIVDPGNVNLEVSARYMARTDCPSTFTLTAFLLNEQVTRVLGSYFSGSMQAPADFWDEAKHVFGPTPGAAFLVFAVFGVDNRFWAGHFGSKATCLSARVLYDDTVQDPNDIIKVDSFSSLPEEHDGSRAKAVVFVESLLSVHYFNRPTR